MSVADGRKGDPWRCEREFYTSGHALVAGVDEVGVGCLAGPVVAAAVILCETNCPKGIDDSKKLTAKRRNELVLQIRSSAIAVAVGWASVDEIDTINILRAAQLAMRRAIEQLAPAPHALLIDGRYPLSLPHPQRSVIGGDGLSISIGAASIVAKVYRDEWMARFDEEYPGYGFAGHKGYGSLEHRERITALGQSPIHRKSFQWKPV